MSNTGTMPSSRPRGVYLKKGLTGNIAVFNENPNDGSLIGKKTSNAGSQSVQDRKNIGTTDLGVTNSLKVPSSNNFNSSSGRINSAKHQDEQV